LWSNGYDSELLFGDAQLEVDIGSGIRFLVVDDHKLLRKVVQDALCAIGAERENIEQAENGEVAYNMLSAKTADRQYEVVILDWYMPEVTGIELLKQCRAESKYDSVTFVMLTFEADKDSILQALEFGASAYIQKPFTELDFREKITTLLHALKEKKI